MGDLIQFNFFIVIGIPTALMVYQGDKNESFFFFLITSKIFPALGRLLWLRSSGYEFKFIFPQKHLVSCNERLCNNKIFRNQAVKL